MCSSGLNGVNVLYCVLNGIYVLYSSVLNDINVWYYCGVEGIYLVAS